MLKEGKSFKYKLIVEGALIGLITGVLISVFRLALTYADEARGKLTEAATSVHGGAFILAAILMVIAAIVSALLIWEPDIAGSGIPQTEAELRGQKDMKWYKVMAGKLAGCALAIGGGLALGREGPSVQLGAMVGKGFARTGHRKLTEERLLITCGAGAGLSAAFGAPLAGAIFSLEEMHRNFSADVLLTTMSASVASDFICANVLGLKPVFGIEISSAVPLRHYWAVILLGVILGAFGALYNRTIDLMQDLFEHIGKGVAKIICAVTGRDVSVIKDGLHPTKFAARSAVFGRMLVIFAAAYLLFFIYPDALGSGSFLVDEIGNGTFGLSALALLLVIKFVYSTASFGSGSPGGIFLPLLVIGSITGGLFSRVLGLAGFDQSYIASFAVIAMAGYFAAIVRAPITGVVLITEMTGDFTTLLPLVLTSLIAYLVAEAMGVVPIYTQLLERSMKNQGAVRRSRSFDALRERKVVLDVEVHVGSRMDGSHVSEFRLPPGTLIISLIRDDAEIIPDGNTFLRGGDKLEILTREADISDVEVIVGKACHELDQANTEVH